MGGTTDRRGVALRAAMAGFALTAACGGSSASNAGPDAAAGVEGGGNPADGAAEASPADASPNGPAAAKTTATSNATCAAIAPFYWEVGDTSGVVASGTTGTGAIQQSTSLNIASASKLWWGAYVVETHRSDLTQIDLPSMEMQSGRTSFGDCQGVTTVDACCAKAGLDGGTNCQVNEGDVGYFYYSGGHFEGYAQSLMLGGDDDTALTAAYTGALGSELTFSFTQPQPAGGMKMSAAVYGQFLRKILAGGLAIHDHLGDNAVCTLPAACPKAHYSPSPLAWHYSYGHWVEDEPTTGDGAFSSPGKFGFYPWIDASKTYYGIVAREDLLPGNGTIEGAPYYKSVLCGRAIRKAFFTGVPQ